jgi:hypothetical protein
MLILLRSKKAIAPLFVILAVVLGLILIYLFLLVPIPLFKSIRTQINYFLILIFWIIFQVGLIFAYYNVGLYFYKGIVIIKTKITDWSINIRHLIIRHS